jgi:hypothetical protein
MAYETMTEWVALGGFWGLVFPVVVGYLILSARRKKARAKMATQSQAPVEIGIAIDALNTKTIHEIIQTFLVSRLGRPWQPISSRNGDELAIWQTEIVGGDHAYVGYDYTQRTSGSSEGIVTDGWTGFVRIMRQDESILLQEFESVHLQEASKSLYSCVRKNPTLGQRQYHAFTFVEGDEEERILFVFEIQLYGRFDDGSTEQIGANIVRYENMIFPKDTSSSVAA